MLGLQNFLVMFMLRLGVFVLGMIGREEIGGAHSKNHCACKQAAEASNHGVQALISNHLIMHCTHNENKQNCTPYLQNLSFAQFRAPHSKQNLVPGTGGTSLSFFGVASFV
jgi:hypothetical protein